MRKPENRVRLYEHKLTYVTALMSTPQFKHCTNINSALDTLITHYIMLTTVGVPTTTTTTATSPTTLKSTTSLLKKVPKP